MTASTNGKRSNTLPVGLDEIQYSHDLLNAILHNDLPVPVEDIIELDEETVAEMASSLNVLCWLLGHDNSQFRENILNLEQALDDAGIEFRFELDS
jgi:DNA polymerase III psi subunit